MESSVSHLPQDPPRVRPKHANDNEPRLRIEVLIPEDSPITQAEIEVFAQLLDDWEAIAVNDNEGDFHG